MQHETKLVLRELGIDLGTGKKVGNKVAYCCPFHQEKTPSFNFKGNSTGNWGKKKIPIKNIVLMTGAKPKGEFEYVKVCGLNEVCGYIKYFKPTLNNQEVSEIIDSLTNISYSYKPATKKYTSPRYTPLINRRNIRMARKISRWLG